MSSRGIVHLKSVLRDHPLLGEVVSGRALETRETYLARAQAEGFEVRDVPGDGRPHSLWPAPGPGGGNPCAYCTAIAGLQAFRESYPGFTAWQGTIVARRHPARPRHAGPPAPWWKGWFHRPRHPERS